ncbi:TPA: hypothetical protein DF272_05625 [Candidatus Falkowbacteria bacterium]|nr:hypothetical protein [Candidatus Falkowbacteria bacterium]
MEPAFGNCLECSVVLTIGEVCSLCPNRFGLAAFGAVSLDDELDLGLINPITNDQTDQGGRNMQLPFSTRDIVHSVIELYGFLVEIFESDNPAVSNSVPGNIERIVQILEHPNDETLLNGVGESTRNLILNIRTWTDQDRLVVAEDLRSIMSNLDYSQLRARYAEMDELLSRSDTSDDVELAASLDEEFDQPGLPVSFVEPPPLPDLRPRVNVVNLMAALSSRNAAAKPGRVAEVVPEQSSATVQTPVVLPDSGDSFSDVGDMTPDDGLSQADEGAPVGSEGSAEAVVVDTNEQKLQILEDLLAQAAKLVVQIEAHESATGHKVTELNDLRDQLDVYLKQNKVELEGMMDDSGKIEDLLKRVDAIRLEIATMADSAEAELRRARQAADDAEAAKAAAEGNQSNEQLIAFGIGVPALFVILLLLVLIL